MKKINKILLGTLTFFAGLNFAYADTCSNMQLTVGAGFDTHIQINGANVLMKGKDGHGEVQYSMYKLQDSEGHEYAAFCRQPGVNPGNASTGFSCKGEVSKSTDSEHNKARNAGIIAIINNGYGNKLGKSGQDYLITNVALRIYDMMWEIGWEKDYIGLGGTYSLNAGAWTNAILHRSLLKKYSQNSSVKQLIDDINREHNGWIRTSNDITSDSHNYEFGSWSENNDNINSGVIDLLVKGLQAAKDADEERLTLIAWGEPIKGSASSENGREVKSLKYNIEMSSQDFSKIGTDNAPEFKVKFECSNCQENGVTYKIKINGEEKDLRNYYDLLTNVDKNSTEAEFNIEVLFTINDNSTLDDCKDLKYKFTYKTKDVSDDTNVYRFVANNCKNSNDCQEFFVYLADENAGNNNDGDEEVEEGTINVCNNQNCDQLKEACEEDKANGNPNSQNCRRYDNRCAQCTTYVSQTVCSLSDVTMDIIEGVTGTNTCTKSTEEEAENEVFKCIIAPDAVADGSDGSEEKKDIADNGYTANDSVGISSDNPFCSVACKENYHLTLPGIQYTKSGRYFTLTANINGNRNCYTSRIRKGTEGEPKAGEEDTFEYKYEKQRQELVNDYNMLVFYKAWKDALRGAGASRVQPALNHNGHYDPYETWVDGYDCGYPWGCAQYTCTGYPNDNYCTYYEYNAGNSANDYSISFRLDDTHDPSYRNRTSENTPASSFSVSLSDTERVTSPKGQSKSIGWSVSCTGTSCTYTSNGVVTNGDDSNAEEAHTADGWDGVSYDELSSYIDGKINEYESKVNEDNRQLKKIYDWYIECTGWTDNMNFNFDPEIAFDYEERAYRLSQEHMIMDKVDLQTPDSNKNIQYCDEKMGDDYECSNWKGSLTKKNPDILICTTDGCSADPVEIPQALEVKVKSEAGAYFYPPIQYANNFPTGAISLDHTAPDPNETTEDSLFGHFVAQEDENGRLIGSWPIGLGTQTGTFNYILKIRNLGQYNDTGELGRIWDEDNTSSNKTVVEVARTDTCHTENEGWGDSGWACAYNVNFKSDVYCKQEDNWIVCPDGDPEKCPASCSGGGGECQTPPCTPTYCLDYNTGEKVYYEGTVLPERCRDCPDCPPKCIDPCTGETYDIEEGQSLPSVCLPRTCNNSGGLEFNHIPTGNVNPNKDVGRQMGINWYDGDTPNTFLELKAYATIKEMEEDSETIYDVSFDNVSQTNSVNNDYALIVKLNSSVLKTIKAYNAAHPEGYANDSLTCYDYESSATGRYEGIFCYSELIDELVQKNGDDIKFTKYRPMGNERKNTSNYDYWTTWDKVQTNHSSWNINTSLLLESQKSYKSNQGIGPAWK